MEAEISLPKEAAQLTNQTVASVEAQLVFQLYEVRLWAQVWAFSKPSPGCV
jgi:hypothetical protein